MKNHYFAFLLLLVCCFEGTKSSAQTPGSYVWQNVQIQGGGFVSGLIFNPAEKDLLYARTDVGGAYRWDAATSTWIPLTDQLGRSEQDNTGVLSLATDPTDPNRVYLATGLYTQSWAGPGAILASTDKGSTWTKTELPIKLGGNEDGRSTGERLQVDPNLGSKLYLGTSTDGLWQSTNYGASWSKVTSFPVATSPIGSGGISFVLFDQASGTAGAATLTIYAGVLQTGTNLYRSTDGGETWQTVPGQPTGNMPHHATQAADGTLYLTYANGPGPNNVTAGAVWKLNTSTGNWTNISPPEGQGGFAGLALDPQHPGTLLVSTLDRWWPGDEVYRSTDDGTTWKPILASATWDYSLAPYAATSKPHWIGDIAFDPFNPNSAWFITGYGVFQTRNLLASDENKPVTWTFQNKGLEETVPLELLSPSAGAHLVSALGDIDGFVHDSLGVSPAAGRLAPSYGTNNSIDFAAKVPAFMVRTYNSASGKYGAYSADGGRTWTAFGSAPADTNGGGSIAVTADGKTVIWSPNGAAGIFYSADNGTTWKSAAGVAKGDLKPETDRVNAKKVYLYDAEDGKVLVSKDGGASFAAGAGGMKSVPSWQTWAASVKAVPGVEGELWLTNPGAGLFRSVDAGSSFVKVANVQEAVKTGFGKAAPGSTHPAVYIAGKVNNEAGYFRSDDAGATWMRINDEQHQFGGVNDITGDPRVYGRLYVATSGRGIVYGDRYDCNSVLGGAAYIDKCNTCVGGNTGKTDCAVTGLEDNLVVTFTYWPNPFTMALQVRSEVPFSYRIISITGAELTAGTSSGRCTLGQQLAKGIYTLIITTSKGSRAVKIVKY
ncbi:xyloglucanase [Pontibacter chitinilyticus]|uniref:xyloglucanase n=1 Tax=Pontibacter chitinilyticus TaxID=2674989 RepID=UPI0032191EC9